MNVNIQKVYGWLNAGLEVRVTIPEDAKRTGKGGRGKVIAAILVPMTYPAILEGVGEDMDVRYNNPEIFFILCICIIYIY